MRRWLLGIAVAAALTAACSSRSLKAAGEQCTATSECGAGLTCDFGVDPPVCANSQTVPVDAAPPLDATEAEVDAAVDAAEDAGVDAS